LGLVEQGAHNEPCRYGDKQAAGRLVGRRRAYCGLRDESPDMRQLEDRVVALLLGHRRRATLVLCLDFVQQGA